MVLNIICFQKQSNRTMRSVNLDSWTPEQLKMMSFGGNGCALTFFKQHGWTDGEKSKYKSRAAELYKQLFSKEVTKIAVEDSANPINGFEPFPELKFVEDPKVKVLETHPILEIPAPKAPCHPVATSSVRKPISARRTATKTGGLGVRKLTTKPSESLYDQKAEEPAPPVVAKPANDPGQKTETSNSGNTRVNGHVTAPKEPLSVTQLVRETAAVMQELTQSGQATCIYLESAPDYLHVYSTPPSVLGTDDRGFTSNENEAPSILTTVGDDEYWSEEAQEISFFSTVNDEGVESGGSCSGKLRLLVMTEMRLQLWVDWKEVASEPRTQHMNALLDIICEVLDKFIVIRGP
ncbi:hypothetical protein C5167_049656 [Papaver somniferum]|uniref:Arf-GAP domain-containing protein n=1 Tax=Papaver somniferum TaxID=3469 RepID=A0A4Y7KPT7_PAPSO|nr:hypothetical protein C5167_049656 [Papaver somniferum]